VLQNDPTIDNVEPLKRIEEWSTRDALKQQIEPNFKPAPNPSVLDKILPR
jgi:hypothetical protein